MLTNFKNEYERYQELATAIKKADIHLGKFNMPEPKRHHHDVGAPISATNHPGSEAPEARYDLVPPESYERLALIYTEGAEKYGDNSWRRYTSDEKFIKSRVSHAEVHWNKWKKGDRSVDHLAKVAWAAFTLMQCQDIDLTGWQQSEHPDDNAQSLQPEPPLFRVFTGRVFPNTHNQTLTFDDDEVVTVIPVYTESLPPPEIWKTHDRWRVTLKEDTILGIVFKKAERLTKPAESKCTQGSPELDELKDHTTTKPPHRSFLWALIQLHAGHFIRRKDWHIASSIRREPNEETYVYDHGHKSHVWNPTPKEKAATDWEVSLYNPIPRMPKEPTPEKEHFPLKIGTFPWALHLAAQGIPVRRHLWARGLTFSYRNNCAHWSAAPDRYDFSPSDIEGLDWQLA